MGDYLYQQCSGVSQAAGKKTAGLIERETNEHRTSNIERRIMYSVYFKKD
jgi:hypothetical protein